MPSVVGGIQVSFMGDTPLDPRLPAHAPLDAAAAARLVRAARAAEELCATLWEAVREELREPRARRVAELSERLAQVCAVVAALAGEEPAPEREPPVAPEPQRPAALEPQPPAPPEEPEIAIHDIRREAPRAPLTPSGEDPQAWIEPGGESPFVGAHPPHRKRGGESPVAWAESIGASLERHAAEGLPFAVLLVEALGVHRLAQEEPAAVLTGLLDRVEAAIERELRPTDTIVREGGGRWWLTASRADSGGARALAERLAPTARAAAVHRGESLGVAIGVAVCPADGEEAATLAAHADVDLYAARAAGRAVAPEDDAA